MQGEFTLIYQAVDSMVERERNNHVRRLTMQKRFVKNCSFY